MAQFDTVIITDTIFSSNIDCFNNWICHVFADVLEAQNGMWNDDDIFHIFIKD